MPVRDRGKCDVLLIKHVKFSAMSIRQVHLVRLIDLEKYDHRTCRGLEPIPRIQKAPPMSLAASRVSLCVCVCVTESVCMCVLRTASYKSH